MFQLHNNFILNVSFIGKCVVGASMIPKCSPGCWAFGFIVLYMKAQVSLNLNDLYIINFELIFRCISLNSEVILLNYSTIP